MDDLEETAKIPEYVGETSVTLMFLARNYFTSKNCALEVDTAVSLSKPLVLCHHSRVHHGGAPLADIMSECPEKHTVAIFGEGANRSPVIPWLRQADFEVASLKQIAVETILGCRIIGTPRAAGAGASPRTTDKTQDSGETCRRDAPVLYLEGEIGLLRWSIPEGRNFTLSYSLANLGAAEVAYQLAAKIDGVAVQHVQLPGGWDERSPQNPKKQLSRAHSRIGALSFPHTSRRASHPNLLARGPSRRQLAVVRDSSRSSAKSSETVGGGKGFFSSSSPSEVFILLLDESTFVGEEGERLAEDVRYALLLQKSIVLVHTSEGEEGGCAFDRFFTTTPSDLVASGLYSERIAISWLRRPGHNDVSIALIAKALGARSRQTTVLEYL